MKKWTTGITIALAVLFAAAGTACNFIDLKDYKDVAPTTPPPGLEVAVPAEPESINDADRSLEDFTFAAKTYIQRRGLDIEREKAKIAMIEGVFDGGLQAFGASVGAIAGPFAPALALFLGYRTKRRKDLTPEEAKAAAAEEKEKSYNAGLEVGKNLAESVLKKGRLDPLTGKPVDA